jgi:sodium/potassium-transporting ATPase subunit alpha
MKPLIAHGTALSLLPAFLMLRRNVAFFSTNCTEGVGKGVVVRTGDKTAIGVIAMNTTQGEKPETLMKQELERFVKIISGIAVSLGVVFFIIAVVIGLSLPSSP